MSILIEQEGEVARLHRGTRRFLLGGLLAIVLIIAAILLRQGLFRQTASLSFVTQSALDLSRGQWVKIAGFRVGKVEAVALRPDGLVEVHLDVDAGHMRFVTQDAVVELHKEGLVGSAVLEIIPGPDKTRLAQDEDRLAFRRSKGFSDMASSLQDKILPILGDIKIITTALADPQQGIPATLAQVREVTRSLNTVLKTGQQQISNLGQAATRTLGQAEQGLVLVDQSLAQVNTRLPLLLDKVQGIADHVEKMTADAVLTVPSILRDGRSVAGDARDIVTGAKSAWPVKNFVDSTASQRIMADSDPRAVSTHGD